MTYIREMLISRTEREEQIYWLEISVVFLSQSKHMAVYFPKLNCDSFRLQYFQFIIQ